MDQHQMTAEEIYAFARRVAMQFLSKQGLNLHEHLMDDATQEIALAGFQNWEKTKDVAFTKKRIRDRMKTWWVRHCIRENRQPKPESTLSAVETDGDEELTAYETRQDRRVEPEQEAAVQDFLENCLTPRQRDIVRFSAAGFSDDEVALQIGVSVRTVQRERQVMKDKYKREFDKHV